MSRLSALPSVTPSSTASALCLTSPQQLYEHENVNVERPRTRLPAHLRRNSVPDLRAIQSLRARVHARRWIPVLDRPLPTGWRLPVYGAGAERIRSAARGGNLLASRLRRTVHCHQLATWSLDKAGQCLRVHLHDDVAVLIQLSRCARAALAILRSIARPLSLGVVFFGFPAGRSGANALGWEEQG